MRRVVFVVAWISALGASTVEAQWFGYQVALDDGRIVVSEPAPLDGLPSIYIYEASGDSWEQTTQLQFPVRPGAGMRESRET